MSIADHLSNIQNKRAGSGSKSSTSPGSGSSSSSSDVGKEVEKGLSNEPLHASVQAQVDDLERGVRGSYLALVRRPTGGSLLTVAKSAVKKKRSKADDVKIGRALIKSVAAGYMDDDVDFQLYMLMRIVMRHSDALFVASKVQSSLAKLNLSTFEYLSAVSDTEISTRSDIKKILKKAVVYHPDLGDIIDEVI
jgi:hypothetical protein